MSWNYALLDSNLQRWNQKPPAGFSAYLDRIRAQRGARDCWLGEEHPRYSWIFSQLVKESAPRAVLELGTQSGGSVYGLTVNLPADSVFVGIDNEESPCAVGAMSDYAQIFPRERSLFCTARSSLVLPLLNQDWDIVHFDHGKDCYLPDLDLLVGRGHISPATICVFHDTATFGSHHAAEIERRFLLRCFAEVNEGALFCQGCRAALGQPEDA